MFRIRAVYDDVTPANTDAIEQVQRILRSQFPGVSATDIARIPKLLRNPFKYRFRAVLFVAEDQRGQVKGFALLLHEPPLHFCYLDFISAAEMKTGRGIGGALYERVREEALSLDAIGLFFECFPDEPELSQNPDIRKQNVARLRFYEKYGARPIVNTAYETPLEPGDDNPPYLLFDGLGRDLPLPRDTAKEIVRAILERKYPDICPASYNEMIIESFHDDPVRLREPKYVKKSPPIPVKVAVPSDKRIALAVNDRHWIHHVEEMGYVESPVRIDSLLDELARVDIFERCAPHHFPEKHITAVHDPKYVDYFERVCRDLEPGQSIYPYVFPIRNAARPPKELPIRAGYYCIDTFTPLNRNAYLAAKRAVDCALTLAQRLVEGHRLAYALVRPPGHHAERRAFGGFCYFNSAAVAANYLSTHGRVAVIDVDYHHGNGQQDIFYQRRDVFTISIHGHPQFAYPHFSGFEEERGEGYGEGYNLNIPLPEVIDAERYRKALARVLRHVSQFKPHFVIVALGLDTAKGDPTGTWSLEADDFEANGQMIGSLRLPMLVVQEGGYDTKVLGVNARRFLIGLWSGAYSSSEFARRQETDSPD